MARARPVAIDCDEPFGVAARRVLGVRAPELLEYVPAARSGHDIEHLHDLRVAMRRLRAVLEVFDGAFPKRPHDRLLRDVKRAGAPLGTARDLDVHIALVERFGEGASPRTRPGVAHLLARMGVERVAAYEAFGPSLDGLESGGFAERAEQLARD